MHDIKQACFDRQEEPARSLCIFPQNCGREFCDCFDGKAEPLDQDYRRYLILMMKAGEHRWAAEKLPWARQLTETQSAPD